MSRRFNPSIRAPGGPSFRLLLLPASVPLRLKAATAGIRLDRRDEGFKRIGVCDEGFKRIGVCATDINVTGTGVANTPK